MGLRETMKAKEQSNKQENNSNEPKKLIEEQAQTIQNQISMISTLQSEKQAMLSTLKEQDLKLKEANSYVEQSKKNEQDKKRALQEMQEALDLSNSVNQRAERAQRQAYAETEIAKKAKEQSQEDSKERYKAQNQVREIEYATKRSRMTYKNLFIGNGIFALILAFFLAYDKREVLTNMLRWFPLRFNNLKSLLSWIAIKYMAAIQFIQTKWELKSIWNYVIVTLIFIGLGVGLFFIVKFLEMTIKDFVKDIHDEYVDKLFKRIVSGNIAFIMLFVCLFFSNPINKVIPFNILSVWLIFSFVGIILWHIPEIKRVFRK